MNDENLLKRINPVALYQPFLAKIELLVANLRARGIEYWALSGERTFAEQQALYDQGRKTPGNIVTNARPGSSLHNFAIACDFCFDKDVTRAGLQPDFEVERYRVLAEEAQKIGLEAGFYWKFQDPPHIQLPIGKAGLKIGDLLAIYNASGKVGVFHKLDQYQW